LNEHQLKIIFSEIPNLRDVELVAWTQALNLNPMNIEDDFMWTPVTDEEEFLNRNKSLWDLLNASMQVKQFTRIRLSARGFLTHVLLSFAKSS